VAKLRNTVEALERRVERKRAAHRKLVARAERTQRRMGELATALQQAETALADAVARMAARHEAKAGRKRPDGATPANGAAPEAGAATLEVTTVAPAPEPEPEPAVGSVAEAAPRPVTARRSRSSATDASPATASARMRTRATAIRRRTASPDAAAAPATTPRAPSQRRGGAG
jgi:hypothetical protein